MKAQYIFILGIVLAVSGCAPSDHHATTIEAEADGAAATASGGRIVEPAGATLSGAAEADWPNWRGPHFNGSSTATALPATFSKTENIVWAVDMPGPSAATPVIWGEHVFLPTTDASTRTQHVMSLDRETGEVRWQQQVGAAYRQDRFSNSASPSAITDGERVIFFFGTGELVAFDFEGKQLWSRSIQQDYGEFAFLWMFSSSPLLHEGTLYLQVLQRDVPVQGRGAKPSGIESYLLAMNPDNGETLWKHIRPSQAVQESREAFSTPIPFEFEGRKEILVVGGDDISGHDPATGKELWRWGTWNPTRINHWRLVPSPVALGNVILACAPKGDPIYAIKAGGSGQLDDSSVLWKTDPRDGGPSSDVPTPLVYQDDFFVLRGTGDRNRHLSRIEPQTGNVKWNIDLPSRTHFQGSPTGADGKIYFQNFAGEVFVVNAADGEILHTVEMGEAGDDFTRSTLSVAHGKLFLRTNSKLFCIGSDPGVAAVEPAESRLLQAAK